METLRRTVQLWKALLPIEVTVSGRTTLEIVLLFLNAFDPMAVTVTPPMVSGTITTASVPL